MTQREIDALLLAAADEEYRKFNAKIVRSELPMIGVRMPYLQQLAKRLGREEKHFLDEYTPQCYEQILLYGLTLAATELPMEKKFDYLDKLLPLLDNWAHVDVIVGAFKELRKHRDAFLARYAYLVTAPEFERRFMVVFLMDYCMDADTLDVVFSLYAQMQCDAYYVNMGIAWGLSAALVKFYERTREFLLRGTMQPWILRKTVQKARESYRISPEQKAELKELFRR